MSDGRLFVVGTPIGNLADVSDHVRTALAEADLIACEDTRRTGGLLAKLGIEGAGRLVSYHEHNERQRTPELVEKLQSGSTIALVSDAGTPLISDPGYRLVDAALEAGVPVEPVPGPSAVMAALSVAGVPPLPFTFLGFLPKKGKARTQMLESIKTAPHTSVFFESPQRIARTLEQLGERTGERTVAVCRELTKLHNEVVRGTAAEVQAALAARGDVKGEITVVVSGAVAEAETVDVEALRAEGLSLSEIARRVAKATGRPKSEVYAELLSEIEP